MAFQDDKDAIVALVKAKNCDSAAYIDQHAITYADLIMMAFENVRTFDCDTTGYLTSLASVIDDAVRIANGIYLNKTDTTVTNPVILINCAYDEVIINAVHDKLMITEGSNIALLTIEENTREVGLYGGSTVTMMEVVAGKSVLVLHIGACDTNISELSNIEYGSEISNIAIDEPGIFGGFTCAPAAVLFTDEISAPVVSLETSGGFKIAWTLPGTASSVKVTYRKEGDINWLTPNITGNATAIVNGGNTEVVFSNLDPNTIYQVKVQCRGIHPGIYSVGIIISASTTALV